MSEQLKLDLIFPPLAGDLAGAVIHIYVEDVGEADAPAPLYAKAEFTDVRVARDAGKLTLHVDLPDLHDALRPAIRVHVDTSRTGAMSSGDFINPAIVDVPAGGRGPCRVELLQIR
jgi:hypothetical protein